MQKINKWQENQYNVGAILEKNINKLGVKKLDEVFSKDCSNKFQSFKEAYRLVVGHAFYKAHKKI